MGIKGAGEKIAGIVFVCLISILLIMNGDSKESIRFTQGSGFLVQHVGETAEDVWTQTFVLEKGDYHFKFNYTASEAGNEVRTYANGLKYNSLSLEKEEETMELDIHLDEACSAFKVAVRYNGAGYLELKSVECIADQPWHRDNWLKTALFLLMVFWFVATRYMFSQQKLSRQTILGMSTVFGMSLLSSVLFFSGNKIGYGDDLQYHLSRIEGIAAGLRNGQFPVMIYPDALGGNGYLNAMYPSVFLYIPACLRLMGVSFVSAYETLLVLINFATAFIMYGSVKSVCRSEKIAVLATTLYLFARYRLNNMLVRGALGETLAMIFVPLVLIGLYHVIVGERKKWWMLLIGATGIIQSHVLSTVMYALIALILVCVFIKKIWLEKRYIELLKCGVLAILLNIGFLVPFLTYYVRGNLNLKAATQMYDMAGGGLNPSYLFGIFDIFQSSFTDNHDYALHLAILCLLGIIMLYALIHRESRTYSDRFCKYSVLIAVFLLFMATNWFPYDKLTFLNVFQFPWRFIGPAVAIIIIVGSICLVRLEVGTKEVNILIFLLIMVTVWDTSIWHLNWNDNIRGHEERDSEVEYRDSDVDKTNADILYWADEYLVQGAGDYLTDYKVADQVQVQQYTKKGLRIMLKYSVLDGSEQWIDLPLQNYIGYQTADESKERYPVITGDYGNVRVQLKEDGNVHELYVYYREPALFRLAEVISLLTLAGLAGWTLRRYIKIIHR